MTIEAPLVLGADDQPVKLKLNYNLTDAGSPDEAISLRSVNDRRLTKRWRQIDPVGTSFGHMDDYVEEGDFIAGRIDMSSLDKIEKAVHSTPSNTCWVRGEPVEWTNEPIKRRSSIRTKQAGYATFNDRPRSWLMIDVDEGTTAPENWTDDPEALAEELIKHHLPPEFHDAGCVVKWSSSMQPGERVAKAHLIFLLSEPIYSIEAWHWLKPHSVDASLFQPVQQHYIAPPVFQSYDYLNTPDPLADIRVFTLEGDPVVVPDIYEYEKPQRPTFGKMGPGRSRPPWQMLLMEIPKTAGERHEFIRDELIIAYVTQEKRLKSNINDQRRELWDAIVKDGGIAKDRLAKMENGEFRRMFDGFWNLYMTEYYGPPHPEDVKEMVKNLPPQERPREKTDEEMIKGALAIAREYLDAVDRRSEKAD